jgi:hypothetical protein
MALLEQLLRAVWPLLSLDSRASRQQQQQQQQQQYRVAAQLQAAAQSAAATALQLLGTVVKAEAPWPAAAVKALQRFEDSSAAAVGGGGYTGLLGMVAKVYCNLNCVTASLHVQGNVQLACPEFLLYCYYRASCKINELLAYKYTLWSKCIWNSCSQCSL